MDVKASSEPSSPNVFSSCPSSPQVTPLSTLTRTVKFNQVMDFEDSYELSNVIEIRSTCILDSTSPLSKLLMITPLALVAAGLSLVTVSEYGSYGELDPNDDRTTVIGKLIFAGSAILLSILSVILVTPDPFYLSGILIIFSNISVPFSWLFSALSLLGLIIISVIYKTIRHNLKAYKDMISPDKYR